jgi:glutamate synthase (NADPH/NADH) small chain
MASGCPINNLIPEWNDLIYRGRWKKPWIASTKPTTSPNSPVGSAPPPAKGPACWASPAPRSPSKTSSIPSPKRAGKRAGLPPLAPSKRTGKKWRGRLRPAGLSAAAQLNSAGHWVTVYERADRPGGLLMYGIPNMKLDKQKVVSAAWTCWKPRASPSSATPKWAKTSPPKP